MLGSVSLWVHLAHNHSFDPRSVGKVKLWQLIRDYQQINFVTLNGFCTLSSPFPLPPFLRTLSGLMEYQPKLNQKYTPFLHCISSFEGIWNFIRYGYQFFYFYYFTFAFTLADIFFHNFLELHSTLSLKTFLLRMFFFFIGSTQVSHSFNAENPLSVTKIFYRCSLNLVNSPYESG